MTTFRGVSPLDTTDPYYFIGYRYAVVTADVTISPAAVAAINTAAGGGTTQDVSMVNAVYTVARTLSEGEADSVVTGSYGPDPALTCSCKFEAVASGVVDGYRICSFPVSLIPPDAPAALSFLCVHYGLVGDVFRVGETENVDDGALTGPGGLKARYYSGRNFLGLPAVETVENIDISRGEQIGTLNMKDFSARWLGYIRMPETGNYRFQFVSDGRGLVILGDNTYIDGWGSNERRNQTGPSKAFAANEYVFIRVDLANTALGWEGRLFWETPSTPGVFTIVPTSVMFYGAKVTLEALRPRGASHYIQAVNRYLEA